jgi:hypothetical protein
VRERPRDGGPVADVCEGGEGEGECERTMALVVARWSGGKTKAETRDETRTYLSLRVDGTATGWLDAWLDLPPPFFYIQVLEPQAIPNTVATAVAGFQSHPLPRH